jgi:hypothetical protein
MSVQEPRRGNGSADESDDLFGDGGGAGPAYLRRAVDGDEVTGSHRSRGLRRPRTDAPARPEKRRTIDLTAVPEARPASSGPTGPDEVSGRLAGIGDRLSGLEANVEQVVEVQERRFRELERRLDSIDASLAHDLPDLVARLGAAAVAVEQTLDEVVAGREALQDGVRRADRAVAGWVEAVRTEAGRLSSASRALGSLGDTVTRSLGRWEQEAGGQHRVLLERLVESLVAGSPARYRRRIAERLLATTGHVRPDAETETTAVEVTPTTEPPVPIVQPAPVEGHTSPTFEQVLSGLSGIGPARLRALEERFGDVATLAQASAPQVRELRGIGPDLAEQIIATAWYATRRG